LKERKRKIMIKLPGKKVAIIPIDDPEKTPGGIYIPEQAKERCDQGIVKYVGPRCTEVKPADYVIFSGYSGTLMFMTGEGRLIIMPEDFIVAVVEMDEHLKFPGLSHEYVGATYQSAVDCIADAFQDLGWDRHLKVKPPLPTREEYDKMRVSK
jgi:chaperonin GroES